MSREATNNLMERIRFACRSAADEWDMHYAEIIGALEMIKAEIMEENDEIEENNEKDGE